MNGMVHIGTKSECTDFPTGVIAGQAEMLGMTGGSEACVIVSIRHDGLYSIKCYRYGEFGTQGDGGKSIWYRIGSSLKIKSAEALIKNVEMWAREIEADLDWENLVFSLQQSYTEHRGKISDLTLALMDGDLIDRAVIEEPIL